MARIIFMPKRKTLLRLTISFVVLVLAIVSLTIFLLYTSTIDEISRQVIKRVRDASVVAARMAERSGVNFYNKNYQKNKAFKKLFAQYHDVLEAMELENIYIIDRDKRCFLIIKGPPIEKADKHVKIERIEFDRSFEGQVILSRYYKKHSKTFISSYAPIFDDKGKADLLVGVDLDVSSGLGIINEIKRSSMTILGVTVFASLLMSAILSYTLVTPIKNMVVAAEQIGLGNFSVEVPVSGRDELGFLGQTMNDMVQDIKQRDTKISRLTKGIIDDLRIYNELILDGMLNGVITFDLDGIIESANPAACRILGTKAEVLVSTDIKELSQLGEQLHERIDAAIETGRFFHNYETRFYRAGKSVLVTSDLAPLIDRDGDNIGHMLFLDDVTEIRKLESQVKLKEKLAAIGELSAGIAHEIRNPLNSIELFLGLLQRKLKGQEDENDLVRKVRDEIKKLNQILSDFLKFARPMPLTLTRVDLRSVISDSIFFSQAEADKRGIQIDSVLPDQAIHADIDAQQVQQVFTNIVLNAAQAIGEGGSIRIWMEDGEYGYQRIFFQDNGPGIPKEEQTRIFDPFFTTKDEGTGLGLAMAHKIVETHGGSIDVTSSPSGTTFIVSLPLAQG